MTKQNIIHAKNIHRYFQSLHVLKGVDLEVKESEILSLVGASGAGKTTLLQILGTLDEPSLKSPLNQPIVSELQMNGVSLIGKKDQELAKFRNENIGFIFQFHHLIPEFDVTENVMLPALITNQNKKDIKNRAEELLVYLGLQDRLTHAPKNLSGGEQQRVAVARALINQPKVVLADEPSGNLDAKSAENLHQLFFDLREKFGQTFVIVTHNESFANMADRKIVMKDGMILI